MTTATIRTTSQVSLPAAAWQTSGVLADHRLDFVRESAERYASVAASRSVQSLKGIVPRPQQPVRLEDMQAAIVAGAAE